MRQTIANMFAGLARLVAGKTAPSGLTGTQWSGTSYVDAFRRNRNPTPNELQAELKSTAWTCASLNSATCASYPPRLYVVTEHHQPSPKCLTKPVPAKALDGIRRRKGLPARLKSAAKIEEVTSHPLTDLLATANPYMNSFDLWELTTVYQEIQGSAYWYLEPGPYGTPANIWILPAQNVTPQRKPGSPNLIDYYEYRTGSQMQEFLPSEIIHFRYPDPRNPYAAGLSPLRAAWEQIALASDYSAMKKSVYENKAIPAAIVSPDQVIGEEERDRYESQWNTKFRRGGSGGVLFAESGLRVQLLSSSMGDLAALADMNATKTDIANAFHVPLSFLTANTNLANLIASNMQHMTTCIGPRLERRDEKLNSQLVPLFDPSGRLFLASEDPTPVDADLTITQQENDLKYGVATINEVRSERGLPPVPWGNVPWLNTRWAPSDVPRIIPAASGQPQRSPADQAGATGQAQTVAAPP